MLRKTIISLVATAALGAGIVTSVDDAEAHRRHHGGINIGFGFVPFFGGGYGYPGFGYPGYGYRHYGYPNYGYRHFSYYDDDYVDCRYRRVAVKKWNKTHTRKIIVYKKKRVCY